jgi:hypothetical protein
LSFLPGQCQLLTFLMVSRAFPHLQHGGIDLVGTEHPLGFAQEVSGGPARLVVVREWDQHLRTRRAAKPCQLLTPSALGNTDVLGHLKPTRETRRCLRQDTVYLQFQAQVAAAPLLQGQDFYLTAREEERDENLLTAARVFAALARSESGERAVSSAIAEVFPWVRHLTAAERDGFAGELIAALSDAAELAFDRTAHEVIAGWRATARIKAERIKADESLYRQALAPTQGDFGPVQAIG